MDDDLKNGLWNIVSIFFINKISTWDRWNGKGDFPNFVTLLWHKFYKLPVDDNPGYFEGQKEYIRKRFFKEDWNKVYEFIEFLASLNFDGVDVKEYVDQINSILEKEFSAYRFVNNQLAPISNETEIESLKESFVKTKAYSAINVCNVHLQNALDKLSDRKNPDYRNSIKESISAVEALAKVISGNQKDSLGAAIDKIKGKLKIHGSLERAIKSIYGYTSDSNGIRHALTEETEVDFEDAKFMLVSCSSFINYLIAKAGKTGIKF